MCYLRGSTFDLCASAQCMGQNQEQVPQPAEHSHMSRGGDTDPRKMALIGRLSYLLTAR